MDLGDRDFHGTAKLHATRTAGPCWLFDHVFVFYFALSFAEGGVDRPQILIYQVGEANVT